MTRKGTPDAWCRELEALVARLLAPALPTYAVTVTSADAEWQARAQATGSVRFGDWPWWVCSHYHAILVPEAEGVAVGRGTGAILQMALNYGMPVFLWDGSDDMRPRQVVRAIEVDRESWTAGWQLECV